MFKCIKKQTFTLLEIIVVLCIFLILTSIIVTIFTSINKTLFLAQNDREIYERARIVLNVISNDLQCAYYGDQTAPFWHHAPVSTWGENNNELLAFISTSPLPVGNYTSALFEVKYQLYYSNDSDEDTAGWALRSITGNLNSSSESNSKWNFNSNFTVGESGSGYAFSADNTSSDNFSKLIPYVTDLSFTCYNQNGTEIDSDIDNTNCTVTSFPYSVKINLSLLDRDSWKKWIKIGGTPKDLQNDPASDFRKQNERTFSQSVLIGNRGQCNQ